MRYIVNTTVLGIITRNVLIVGKIRRKMTKLTFKQLRKNVNKYLVRLKSDEPDYIHLTNQAWDKWVKNLGKVCFVCKREFRNVHGTHIHIGKIHKPEWIIK